MNMRILTVAILGFICSTAANAASFVVNEAIDSSRISNDVGYHEILEDLVQPLSLSIGDEVQVNISFVNGVFKSIARPSFARITLLGDIPNYRISSDYSYNFINPLGPVYVAPRFVVPFNEINVVDATLLPLSTITYKSVQFSGISVDFSLKESGYFTNYPAFEKFTQLRFQYGTGTIPEPTTWALFIVGFGLTGFAARKARLVRTVVAP